MCIGEGPINWVSFHDGRHGRPAGIQNQACTLNLYDGLLQAASKLDAGSGSDDPNSQRFTCDDVFLWGHFHCGTDNAGSSDQGAVGGVDE